MQKKTHNKPPGLHTSYFILREGFTLLETLVAIFVITVAIAGIFGLVSRLTATVSQSSSRLTAAYLAQEGIEIVRNIRDSNWLGGVAWDNNIPSSGEYGADYTTQSFPDPACGNENLKFDGSFYSCTSDSHTKFKRKINFSKSGDKIEVQVIVEWESGGATHQLIAKENLYKWYK